MRLDAIYMPTEDGRTQPAPYVMTDIDVARFLRSECGNIEESLRRYREKGLKGTQMGKRLVYTLPDVLAFLKSRVNE